MDVDLSSIVGLFFSYNWSLLRFCEKVEVDRLLDSLMSISLVSSPRSSSSSSACRTPSPALPTAAGGSKGGCAECGEEEEQEHMMFCLLSSSLLAPVFLDRFLAFCV